MDKKIYTREEKIKYYTYMRMQLEYRLERVVRRLEYLNSEEYQDWRSDLQEDLQYKKSKKKKKAR